MKLNLSPALLVVAVNSLVAMGAIGFLAYAKLVYKRPVITEHGERARIEKSRMLPAPLATPGTLVFDPMVVNIESAPANPKPLDNTSQQIEGKYHYATVGFVLELRDVAKKDIVEEARPLVVDKFLSLIGRKSFKDLTTVQGRYLLKTQLLDGVNQLINERSGLAAKDALVTNIYFTQFIVQ